MLQQGFEHTTVLWLNACMPSWKLSHALCSKCKSYTLNPKPYRLCVCLGRIPKHSKPRESSQRTSKSHCTAATGNSSGSGRRTFIVYHPKVIEV